MSGTQIKIKKFLPETGKPKTGKPKITKLKITKKRKPRSKKLDAIATKPIKTDLEHKNETAAQSIAKTKKSRQNYLSDMRTKQQEFKIDGKAEGFDPTCTSTNGLFGREKILYIAMFGTGLPITKYYKELYAMTFGGAGSTDKFGKREERMILLEECRKCPALCKYFKLMTHYINGYVDYQQDLVVVWAGGNIITIFAKLLKNILDKCRNQGTVLDSINSTILSEEMRLEICHCFDENDQLIEIVETVDAHPWSDLDCNVLPLFYRPEEREVLFNVYNLNLDPAVDPNIVFDLQQHQPHVVLTLDPLSDLNYENVSANEDEFCHRAEELLIHRLNEQYDLSMEDEDEDEDEDAQSEYDEEDYDDDDDDEYENNAVMANDGLYIEDVGDDDFGGARKITGGAIGDGKKIGFALIRGKTEKECKILINPITGTQLTNPAFIDFYSKNCLSMNSNYSDCSYILKGFGRALTKNLVDAQGLIMTEPDPIDIKLFSAGAERAHLDLINDGLLQYLNFTNPHNQNNQELYEKCINYYKCLLIKKDLNASLTKDHIKHLFDWCTNVKYQRSELTSVVEYLKDTMAEINLKLSISFPGSISKRNLVKNFKSLANIFMPLTHENGNQITVMQRRGKCVEEYVNISLASLTAKVLFFYYTNNRTKEISDYVDAKFKTHGVSFTFQGMSTILSCEAKMSTIYKNVTSINGVVQCGEYYHQDQDDECNYINEQVKNISQSLRVWFEDFHGRFSRWGWDTNGIRIAPSDRNERQEIFNINAMLSVKLTPNSIALPHGGAEDDPDGGELEVCLTETIPKDNICENPNNDPEKCCDGLFADINAESRCLTGGFKPRKTKKLNPRKTKQRKQPKQKISKKRSKK